MTHSVSGVPHRISGRLDFDSGHGLLLCCLCFGSLQSAQQSVNRNCFVLQCTSLPQALVIGLSLQVLIVLLVKGGIVSSFPCCSPSVRDTLKTTNETLKSPLVHSQAIAHKGLGHHAICRNWWDKFSGFHCPRQTHVRVSRPEPKGDIAHSGCRTACFFFLNSLEKNKNTPNPLLQFSFILHIFSSWQAKLQKIQK